MNKRNQNLNSYTESDSKSSSIIPGDRSRFLASKKAAMKKRILEIINLEERAFSSKDFVKFHVNGLPVEIDDRIVRNYMSEFKKNGEIIPIGNSYYSIPGKDFGLPNVRNSIMEVIPESVLKKTPIYHWLLRQPADKQALHDIRISFAADGIWDRLSKLYPDAVELGNEDIELPKQSHFGYMEVTTRIHKTNKVSVSVACSGRPIAIETVDLLQFIEAMTRTEMSYNAIANTNNDKTIYIPSFRSWMVIMWHFGIDLLNTCEEKEFHVTIQEGISDLYRIYTKRLEDGRGVVRLEHQEYPNQQLYDAILNRLYDNNGNLIDAN